MFGIVSLINNFYEKKEKYSTIEEKIKIESLIKNFFQSDTVAEQLEAAREIWILLRDKIQDREEITDVKSTIIDNGNDYEYR